MTAQARARTSRKRPALRSEDYHALGDFRRALRQFLAHGEAQARELGLTPQQHQALLAIRAYDGEGGMTVSALADSLMIKHHSAVGLVDRLADRGLAVRVASAVDRRRVMICLTPQAAARLEALSRKNLGDLARAADTLQQLVDTLRRLDGEAPSAGKGRLTPSSSTPGA